MPHDLLENIPLFAKMSEGDRADLQQLMRSRRYADGEAIVWVGETGDEFFVIQHGTVEICLPEGRDGSEETPRRPEAGRAGMGPAGTGTGRGKRRGGRRGPESVLAVLGPGQFFGEISLIDGGKRTATARAGGAVTLLVLGREQFHQFVRNHPSAAIHVMTVLGQRQRETVDKLRGIRNVNDAVEARRTPIQRLVEKIARLGASELFLFVNLLFFTSWIAVNVARGPDAFDQPPTFFMLTFMISVEAILLSICVLNTQRRQAERDSIKADLDYQTNRMAHLEILQLHEKVDRLTADLRRMTDERAAAFPRASADEVGPSLYAAMDEAGEQSGNETNPPEAPTNPLQA